MSIELHSAKMIKHALEAFQDGEYNGEKSIVLRFHKPFFSQRMEEDVKDDLVNLVGSLPSGLTKLTMEPIEEKPLYPIGFKCFVPVEMVRSAIKKARALEMLTLDRVVLIGDEEAFKRLATFVDTHPKLEEVNLDCESREGVWTNDSVESWLNPVVLALGSVKTLKTVNFNDYRQNSHKHKLSHDALEAICKLPLLEKLALHGFDIQDEHLRTIAQHLQNKEHLKEELSLACHSLGKDGGDALERIVRGNKCPRIFRLLIHSLEASQSATHDRILSFIQEFEGNKHKTLQLTVPTANSGLEFTTAHVRQMLRRNYELNTVYLQYYTGKIPRRYCYKGDDEEVDFLLKTNKLGRGKLFIDQDSDSSTTWLKMLDATDYDLNNIYYLVQSSPLKFCELMEKHSQESKVPDIRAMKSMLRANMMSMQTALKGVIGKVNDMLDSQYSNICESVSEAMAEETKKIMNALKDVMQPTELADTVQEAVKETMAEEKKTVVEALRGALAIPAITKNQKKKIVKAIGTKMDEATKRVCSTIESKATMESKATQPYEKAKEHEAVNLQEHTSKLEAVEGAIETLRAQMEQQTNATGKRIETVKKDVEKKVGDGLTTLSVGLGTLSVSVGGIDKKVEDKLTALSSSVEKAKKEILGTKDSGGLTALSVLHVVEKAKKEILEGVDQKVQDGLAVVDKVKKENKEILEAMTSLHVAMEIQAADSKSAVQRHERLMQGFIVCAGLFVAALLVNK